MLALLSLALTAASAGAEAAPGASAASPLISLTPRQTLAPKLACEGLARATTQESEGIHFRVMSAKVEQAQGESPAFCMVRAYAAPQTDFELRLPLTGYTGRYLQGGCGGLCGFIGDSIQPRCSSAHLHSGAFAVAFENGGHHAANLGDATWAAGDPELLAQFAYKAAHAVAVSSKTLIAQFYGQAPAFNYFAGCSDGGREALMEAQRYPKDFNGVVAGSSVSMPAAMQLFLWEAQKGLYPDGRAILTPQSVQLLHAAVLKSCDKLDGIPDGQIDDPRQCHFDPAKLQCPVGKANAPDCLNAAQVAAATAYYRGPTDPNGQALYPGGAPYGAELGWVGPGAVTGSGKFAAQSFLQYILFQGQLPSDFSWKDWRFTRESLARLLQAGAIYDATDPDLGAFRSAGGKLLMWQGVADNMGGDYGMLDYYQAVRDRAGGLSAARQFARMFLVPAGYHCAGGYIQYNEDFLGAVVKWVEAANAPDTVMASAKLDDGAVRNRPLYAYPTKTRYLGGDVNAAASFAPVAPKQEPADGFDWPGSKAAAKPLRAPL